MIIPNNSDANVERHKAKLGLTGDVYLVNNHLMESLASHKAMFPESAATTIQAAEAERIAYEQEQEQIRAAQAAQAALEAQQAASNEEPTENADEEVAPEEE